MWQIYFIDFSINIYFRNASFGQDAVGSDNAIINNIICNGTESDLGECTSWPWSRTTCSSSKTAVVNCRVRGIRVSFFFKLFLRLLQVYNESYNLRIFDQNFSFCKAWYCAKRLMKKHGFMHCFQKMKPNKNSGLDELIIFRYSNPSYQWRNAFLG